MPDRNVELYRFRAQESFRQAQLGPNESDKAMWLRMAAHWLDLAARVEEMAAVKKSEKLEPLEHSGGDVNVSPTA